MDTSNSYKLGIPLIVGSIAAFTAHQVYPELSLTSALIVLFCASWLVYRFTTGERIWNTFGFMKHPPIAGLIAAFISFIYFSLEYRPFPEAFLISIGFLVVGVVMGAWLNKYWNIGG